MYVLGVAAMGGGVIPSKQVVQLAGWGQLAGWQGGVSWQGGVVPLERAR